MNAFIDAIQTVGDVANNLKGVFKCFYFHAIVCSFILTSIKRTQIGISFYNFVISATQIDTIFKVK